MCPALGRALDLVLIFRCVLEDFVNWILLLVVGLVEIENISYVNGQHYGTFLET